MIMWDEGLGGPFPQHSYGVSSLCVHSGYASFDELVGLSTSLHVPCTLFWGCCA